LTFFGFIGLSVPNIMMALVLMFVAMFWFDASVSGLFSPEYIEAPWSLAKVWDLLKHLWIPVVVLGTAGTAQLIRIMRGNLLDTLGQPYVMTARAKGVKERVVTYKYAVRVAINPLISVMGMQLPQVISGATVTAIVLGLPTTGPVFVRALMSQDMYLAGTFLMFLSFLLLLGNLLADILLVWADPRIRFDRQS
jgi:peptide/nickel transport system permease protein